MANARQGVSGLSVGDSEKNNRRTYDSPELFGELREVSIEHAGKEYRLRITSNEKHGVLQERLRVVEKKAL